MTNDTFDLPTAADLAEAPETAAAVETPTQEVPAVAATETPAAPPAEKTKAPRKSRAKPAAEKGDPNKGRTTATTGKAGVLKIVTPPETKVRTVPLESLVFHESLQQRANLFDEQTVEDYRLIYRDAKEDRGADKAGDAMDPLEAIELSEDEAKELGFASRVVVWNGFQRGEAAQREKLKTLPVKVGKGTFRLARMLSLGANSRGTLPRSFADLRRAFQTLIDTRDDGPDGMLAEVLAAGVGKGGAQRAICAAVGCSKGFCGKMLAAMGLQAAGDKLRKLPDPNPNQTGPKKRTQPDPEGGGRVEDPSNIAARATAALIEEITKSVAGIQRRVESLLTREDAAPTFKEIARKNGCPVKRDHTKTGTDHNGDTQLGSAEYWPAIDVLVTIFDALKDEHAKTQTSPTK